jgi:uncharacterized membrane protein
MAVILRGDNMETVIGLFDHASHAQQAVQAIREYGVDNSHISVVTRNRDSVKQGDFNVGENAAKGATAGGLIGFLAGLGTILIPGIGPVWATGAIASALVTTLESTAVGAGLGAAAGGMLGALREVGFSQKDAEFYAEGLKRGGVLVAIEIDAQREEQIRDILRSAGAVDINNRRRAWLDEGWTNYDEKDPTEDTDREAPPDRYEQL